MHDDLGQHVIDLDVSLRRLVGQGPVATFDTAFASIPGLGISTWAVLAGHYIVHVVRHSRFVDKPKTVC